MSIQQAAYFMRMGKLVYRIGWGITSEQLGWLTLGHDELGLYHKYSEFSKATYRGKVFTLEDLEANDWNVVAPGVMK